MVRGGPGPQGNTSLGNTSAGCNPGSPRLPHLTLLSLWDQRGLKAAPLEQGGPDLHQKQIPCSLGLGHRDVCEQGRSWQAASTRGHSQGTCVSFRCSQGVRLACPLHLSGSPCTVPAFNIPNPEFPSFAQALVSNLSSAPKHQK